VRTVPGRGGVSGLPTDDAGAIDALDFALFRKLARRLSPFLMLLYLVAYLDRVNLSFAALTMNQDLGIGPRMFGLGSGIFFVGYLLLEVPSNLALERFGARRWIARIMISWGIVSSMMALTHGPISYLSLRFLLGVAEAGFFPGIILYLTYWLPAAERTRLNALFILAIPIASVVGAPLSTALLQLDGRLGLAGWQWLFLLEGLPAVVLGFVVLRLLPDGPADARFLTADEKQRLQDLLARERSSPPQQHAGLRQTALWQTLTSPGVLALSLVYFGLMIGLYGLGFWIPKILVQRGLSVRLAGWSTAIPYALGAVLMWLWSRHSDRTRERLWHIVIAAAAGAAGVALAGLADNGVLATLGFALGAGGVFAAMPAFWTYAARTLEGQAAAGGIAMINSLGNLGGFVGPFVMGWLRQSTGAYTSGLFAVAGFLLLAAVVAWLQGRQAMTAAGGLR
jgi:MFS transporter, ACS family, tartrate transporter